MKNSRRGASPEMVFLVSILIIGLVIVMVYLYLAAQTIDKAAYQVGSSGGVIEVDRVFTKWASENHEVLAGDWSKIGQSVTRAFESEGWCGFTFCVESEKGISCTMNVFKSRCPVTAGLSAGNQYERTILIPKEGKAVPVFFKGGFEQ